MKRAEMSSWLNAESSAASELNLEEGELLSSASCEYMVAKLIGEGCFGKVVQCWNVDSLEEVAIKVLKNDKVEDIEFELSMLETISVLDPDQTNLVRFLESFDHMGHTCLVFEKLDVDLFGLLELDDFKPMCLIEIRDVAEQLLLALDALKGLAVLHGDIKPDNAMLVSAEERPMKVKLVDFGGAVLASQVYLGMALQPIGYRAPEVCLGLPFNEAVDVWGVGCVLAFLYLGGNLFPIHCNYQMMRSIVQILGQPPDHQLSEGKYTSNFFCEEEVDDDGPRWRLMTPEEYSAVNATPAQEEEDYFDFPGGLDDLMEIFPVLDDIEWEERAALVHLLKGLLHLDGEQRLTPCEALQHPFITRSFLNQDPLNQEPLTQNPFNQEPLHQDPLNQEPLHQDPLNWDPLNEEPLNQDPLTQNPFNQEPLHQDPLNQEPLHQDPLNQEPLHQNPLNQESLHQDPLNWDLLNQEPLHQDSLNQDPLNQDPLNQDLLHQEPLQHDPLNQDPLNQNPLHQDPPNQNPLNQEPLHQDHLNQKPLIQDPLHQEPLHQEPLHQNPLNQEPLHQDPLNRDPLNQEPLNQEPLHQDSLKQGPLHQDPLHQDPLNQDPFNQDPLNQDHLNQDPLNQDPLHQDSIYQDPLNQDLLHQEPLHQDPLNQVPLHQDPLNQDPLNQEPLHQDHLNQEPLNQDPLHQDPLYQDPLKQDPLNQDPLYQDPLSGPSQNQTSDCPLAESGFSSHQDPQDSDSGLSELSGTFSEVATVGSITEPGVDVEVEASGSSEEKCGAKDVPPGTTSCFRQLRKTIRRVFKTARNTLFCCFYPQIDD